MDNTDKIQKLRDKYKSSLADKFVAISELLLILSTDVSNSINGAAASDEVYIEIYQYLHKLAGSSGMYDYSEIAELSRAAILSSQRKDAQLLVEQLNKLRDLLQQYT